MIFGAVTLEKKRLLSFVKILQKWAYLADYLGTRSTNLDQLLIFDRHMGGNN